MVSACLYATVWILATAACYVKSATPTQQQLQTLNQLKGVPIVHLAYKNGIPVSDIPSYTVTGLSNKTLQVHPDIIAQVFNIEPDVLQLAEIRRFDQLPALIAKELPNPRRNYSVIHIYTLSFEGLINAFLNHKNETLGLISFEGSIRYLAKNVTLGELRSIYNLSQVDFDSTSITVFALQNTGASIKELALAEDMTVEQEIILNSLSFGDVKAILHLNQVMFDAMTMMDLGQRLLATISPLFGSKLSDIAGQCSVSPSEYKNVTLERLIERCLNVSLPILTKLPQTRALGPILQVFTVMDITRTLNITADTISQYNITHIARLLGVRYQKLVREAELPVVLLAGRMGISFTALPTYKIATLASALLGLQFDILQKVYQIPPQQLSASSSITFNHLPMLVYQEVGKNYSVRHLYTMSFAGLVQAFFVHQNATLGFMSYEKSIGFMATKVKLLELRNLYSLNLSNFLALSIPSFALQYTGASIKELALAEDMTTEQEIILKSLSFGDVKTILHLNQVMFDAMTMMDLGQRLLATISPLFGSKLSSIAGQCSVSPSEYKNVTLERLIERCLNVSLPILTKLPQTRALGPILQVFTVMDITRTLNITADTIFQHNITHTARLLGVRYQKLVREAELPVVLLAGRMGISFTALPTYKIATLASALLGLQFDILQKVYQIPPQQLSASSSITFNHLPMLVYQEVGKNYSVRHLYTMSFAGLVQAFFVHQNATLGFMSYEKSIGFMATKVKLLELRNLYSLNLSNFLALSIPSFALQYTGASIKELALAEGMTVEQEIILKSLSFGDVKTILHLNQVMFDVMTMMDLGQRLLATISPLFGSKLSSIAGQCSVSPSEYKNVTLERLIERCLNVSLPILTKLPQTRALGPILQVFTVMDITRTLNITADTIFQYNLTHIARLLGVRYQKLVQEAELPVVLLAGRMGISFTALPTYKIATLASALLGLQFDILQKVYQIPPQQLSASSSITFNHLPMLVYQEVGKNYSVRHLYTMSFAGLVQAFFVHQNATLGFMSYEKSIGFMATKVKLLELRNLYSLNLSNFLALSIPSFALQYTGASIKELALAEGMTVEQEIILKSLSFGDVKTILHLNQVMFDAMTMMDLGQRLLATISPLFGSKLSSIAGQCSVSPSEYKNVTLERLIERCLNVSLPILTKLPQTRALGPVLQVFTVMDITKTLNITVDTIFQYNITHIARLLGVRYQKLVREAELPVVLLAGRMGISFTALPTYKIATLASALLGLQFDILQKVYQIPPQQLSASSSITFNHLPMLVYQEVGKNYSVRHLYTMSFAGLVQAFFVHQNATLGFMSYEKSIGFMATKVKLLELRNLYSLNLSNFLALSIPSFALQYTGASIKELALAEGMTVEQEIILKSLSFGDVKTILHLNQVMFDAMTMMDLGQRLLATISPLFGSKLSSIAGQCSVSPSEYKNVTLERLIERCLNVSLLILTKLPQTRALGPILQVFTVMDITKTLNITVDTIFQYNITHIARLLGVRYQKLVREAELPVVLLAGRMGISFTALPTYKIATLASALLGLQFDILQKVYQIPPQQLSASSSITFNHLPMLVYQEVGKNYSVRHLYTMSFAGLVQAFFVHQNATLGFMSYEKSIGFMATKVKLLELRNLYSLNLSNFLALSIPSFALQYTGASIKELALAEGMTVEQEIILKSLSFGDVKTILHLNQVMFDAMTMMDLGQRLLATISPLFGSKLSSIAGQCSVSPSEYKNVTLERLIERCLNVSLLILTKLPQTRALGPILQVFTVMDITRTLNITVDTIFQYNITHIARLLGRRLQVLQNDVSNVPIVVIAYRSKIAYEAIPQKTTLGLLEEVTGLTEPLLVKVFKVSLSTVPMLKALKFGQIPATVKALNITGVELVVSHFYTMSFIDLIFPVLIRRSASEAAKAIEKGITYLAVRLKLSEIQQIYKIQNLDFLEHSFHTLTAKYAAVTGKDIAKALNLTLEQEHLLTYVRFGDAQIYLKLGRSLYMHTSNDLGKKLLAMGRETAGLFTPFKVTKPSDLESVSLIQYLLTTGLKQVNINSVLSNLGVTDDLQIVFSHYEVADFAEPLKIITSQMAKMPPFQIMRKIVSFFSTVPDKCSQFPAACIPTAYCRNVPNAVVCRCKEGLAGNGTYCFDGCQQNPCPKDAICANVPEKGAECICKDFGFEYEGGECQPKYGADVKIVKVTEVKFNQSYNEKFADKDSTEFKSKKAELEILLKITICSYISCIDIIVVAITKGSINVEFNAIFPSNVTTATPAAVTTATKQALSDPRLQVLNPDVNSLPKAQVSDRCAIGEHNCDSNSYCVPGNGGASYSCKCKDGYEKDGNKCKEKVNVAAIVVPVVMVALILLLVVIVILKRYQNRRGKQTVLDTTQPYSVFRADSVSSSTSAIGSKAGSVELRDSDGMKLGNVYEKSVDDKV